ncbi:putative pseudouridine synthase [Selenomonas ruminantium subsp. lactilytica TAM6421]|uniref:Pseudouridine synthase n=1 Tax=Selenomonas ruminantium subsp. lactilytica (strain NBRC 103574 / TAM6421) TaxID=927704 RepID=I0GSB4_SELRL|nr:pseudouridine synthase [Selenomonas ruminantium]BAL83651.1 putative pseudouridine synthase [Selenomonas ruminantium subsp. lactilytica TAM6421]
MAERLQKIIAQAGIASRRAAEGLILAGRVTVDGKVIMELGGKYESSQRICVDGKPLTLAEEKVYFLLNKPKGYLSTAKDERGRRTVLDLLPEVKQRVYPLGRLDNNTEGLLLISNDGQLMNGLLHPRYKVNKTYVARVAPVPAENALDKLRQGIRLEDGLTAPAVVRLLDTVEDEAKVEITIHEGRNRQVRRMFAAIGCDVRALKRIRFAKLNLAGVKRGHYRPLTDAEVAELYHIAGIEQA